MNFARDSTIHTSATTAGAGGGGGGGGGSAVGSDGGDGGAGAGDDWMIGRESFEIQDSSATLL